ncbi:KH domain-containing protein [Antribacter gilvus]|uniref:KH domain-containing protein n=1 Tax=Antribacter gilvus TaxID=2304675 RepID=UPI000F79E817|nr:KH domain-containing protein [Antribacter gilvus]
MNDTTLWGVLGLLAGIALVAYAIRAVRSRRTGLPDGAGIRYTQHARQRMRLRRVSMAEVQTVLRSPSSSTRDHEENSVRLERDFADPDGDHRTLKVWVAEPWPARHEVVIKSTAWSYQRDLRIPPALVGRLIGAGGSTVSAIESATGSRVDIERRTGTVTIHNGDKASIAAAARMVEKAIGQSAPRTVRPS